MKGRESVVGLRDGPADGADAWMGMVFRLIGRLWGWAGVLVNREKARKPRNLKGRGTTEYAEYTDGCRDRAVLWMDGIAIDQGVNSNERPSGALRYPRNRCAFLKWKCAQTPFGTHH
jgi:hypothetical protein